MSLDDSAADGEPQPCSSALPLARQPIKFLEDLVEVLGRNARATVRDLHYYGVALVSRRELERAPLRRVLGGVLEQVDEHLLDQHGVDRHEREILRQAYVDLSITQPFIHAIQYGADDLLERLPLFRNLHRSRRDLGHVEEVLHEAVEALGFLVDR